MASQLQIYNPQNFAAVATIQPRPTELVESKTLQPGESWYVSPPSREGTWLAFTNTDTQNLYASKLLREGVTIAQLLLDTEVGVVFKQSPEEKLSLENGLNDVVKVEYQIMGTIAVSENTLAPHGKPGSVVVAEQQPGPDQFLWIRFFREDNTTLTTFVADDSMAIVSVMGKEHWFIGTPF